MNKCINCGEEFSAERSTAKFCSDKCKLQHNRKKLSVSNPELSVSQNDTLTPLSVSKSITPRTVNKTFDGKVSFANEEKEKVDAFIQTAIAHKIEQGPNHPLNKNKFTDDGAFITYFK